MIKSTCWKTYYNMLLMKNLGIKRKSPLKVKKINTLKNIFTNRKKEKKKQFKEIIKHYNHQSLQITKRYKSSSTLQIIKHTTNHQELQIIKHYKSSITTIINHYNHQWLLLLPIKSKPKSSSTANQWTSKLSWQLARATYYDS